MLASPQFRAEKLDGQGSDHEDVRGTRQRQRVGGARLDPDVKTKLSKLAERAVTMLVRLIRDEDERGGAIQEGAGAFHKLGSKMVEFARMMGTFPALNDNMLTAAFFGNPPLWDSSELNFLR